MSDGIETSRVVRVEAGELRRVEVRPGDLFVLTVAEGFSEQEAAEVSDRWREQVGADVPLMIVQGAELMVCRPVPAEQP